jgi:hypothetical protein
VKGQCGKCNKAILSKGSGNKPGGHPSGERKENPTDAGFEKDRVKSQHGKGKAKVVSTWFDKGEPPKGQAQVEYEAVQSAASAEANDAVSKQKIPPAYRNYVRDYFDSIRVPNK